MAQILIRKLEPQLKDRLRERAHRHSRSMEEEAREILRTSLNPAVGPEIGLGSQIVALFSGQGIGIEEPIAEMRGFNLEPMSLEPMSFDE